MKDKLVNFDKAIEMNQYMNIRSIFNKSSLGRLYKHIPNQARSDILQRTTYYDRIGPLTIPSDINGDVVDLSLYYYMFYDRKSEYFMITKNKELKFVNPYIRISSNCFYGFIVNSKRCDCKWQLDQAMNLLSHEQDDFLIIFSVSDHGKGIEGGLRGHALLYALGQRLNQELIFDAYEKNGFKSDSRDYNDIDRILTSLNIRNIRLLTNNPERVSYFVSNGYNVESLPIEQPYDKYLSEELGMKKQKLGHNLNIKGFKEDDIEVLGLSKKAFES